MKKLLKKLLPKSVINLYHLILVSLAAFFYGYPSRKIRVIGVTGTKGKSTTCFLITKILEEAGYKVALSSTVLFKIAKKEWLNPYKMTMLGRFSLQRFIRQAAKAHCDYLVLEVSSEGLAQNRHYGIEFDTAVFTNLSPEHIESHGSFEKYKEAKGKLFRSLSRSIIKPLRQRQGKTIIANLDDENMDYFLQFSADQKIGFTAHPSQTPQITNYQLQVTIFANDLVIDKGGSNFTVDGTKIYLNLLGEFNVYNALTAIATAIGEGIALDIAQRSLAKIKVVPGRVEFIDAGQPFQVIVDYAHEPNSLEQLFKTIKLLEPRRIIHVFGPTGGGRDTHTRVKLGEISAKNSNITIITTDDPYDDDPGRLADLPVEGAKRFGKVLDENLLIILDRQESIKKAITIANEGDLILITGKGAEQVMVMGGRKIPWDDRIIAREALRRGGY